MKKKTHLVFLCFLYSLTCFSQVAIKGKITDENHEPLELVSISIHELHKGTYSNEQGEFSFSNIENGNYHLHIFYLGYKALTIDTIIINNKSVTLNIELKPIINELDEVIIETNPFKNFQKESSLHVQVINKKELEKNGGTTLLNSLEKVEGVSTINQGVGISKPVIRGMSGNRIIVNDLGIKQEGQQWGMDHGLEIDQFTIENIQVLKGASSLMYGSDAMAGVLNITPDIQLDTNTYLHNVQTFYRSNNHTKGLTIGSKGRSKDFSYKFRVSGSTYQDYQVPTDNYTYLGYVLPIYNNQLKNTGGKELHINTSVGLKKKWGYQYITISNYHQKIGVFSGATGLPREYNLSPNDPNELELPYQLINHFKIISNSNFKVKKNWLEMDLGFQINNRKEFEKAVAHGFPINKSDSLGVDLQLITFSWNIRYHASLFKKSNGIVGIQGQVQENKIDGFDFIIPAYTQQQTGIYWIETYKVSKKLILNGGLRVDFAALQSNQTIMPFYNNKEYLADVIRTPNIQRNFANLSGSIGAAYQWTKQIDLKLNLGKTFRTPTFAELASNGAHHGSFRYEKGDENLKAEQGYQLDFALNYERKKIHISLTPFYNYFTNFIYLSPANIFPTAIVNNKKYPYPSSGQLHEYKQASIHHYGGEFALHYHPKKFLSIEGSLENVQNYNIDTQLSLPFSPPTNTQFFIEYHPETITSYFQKNFIRLNMGFYTAQTKVDRNELTTDSYQLMNLSIGTRLGKKNTKTQLIFQIQNLLNENYLNHLSRYRLINVPEPARNYVISLKVSF